MPDSALPRRGRRRHYNGPPLPPFVLLTFLESRGFRLKTQGRGPRERCVFYHRQLPSSWPLVMQRPARRDQTVDGRVIDNMFNLFEAACERGLFDSVAEQVQALRDLISEITQDPEAFETAKQCPPPHGS